jgi:hypothetical protein
MKLVNETQQQVFFSISCTGMADCGTIDPDGVSDWPGYDNQENVTVEFNPTGDTGSFTMTVDDTHTGEQMEMALVAE